MVKMYSCIASIVVVMSLPLMVSAQYGQFGSRGLLEKKMFYVDEDGKTGMCSFWSLNLGAHACKLENEYPGEGRIVVDAKVNFNFLSSMYVEGKGYSKRGKIDTDAKFAVADGEGVTIIEPEQIDYVANYGKIVKPDSSAPTALILVAQKNQCTINRMLLRVFVYDNTLKELKFDKDVAIKAFAFSKESLQKVSK